MQKIMILINNLTEIEDYKKVGITNFLFAVKEFSIGYTSFELDKIPKDSYLLINRLLDSDDVDKIKLIKNNLLEFKGIIFEDISIYNIFKNDNIDLIWNQNHFATNSTSINFWLERVKSAIISNEITENEIIEIVNNASKPLVFDVFGRNMIMYSRRLLLSNFNEYKNIEKVKEANLLENISNNNFLIKEFEKGTCVFDNNYFNYSNVLVDDDKILFYLYMNQDLKSKELIEVINGKNIGDDGFLNKETIYRIGDAK